MCQDRSPESKRSQLKCLPALQSLAAPFSLCPHLLSGGDRSALPQLLGRGLSKLDTCAEQCLARNVRVG